MKKTGPWEKHEEQQLIRMRSDGSTWEQASSSLGRSVMVIKKRSYALPDNGSEGRKRIKVAAFPFDDEVAEDLDQQSDGEAVSEAEDDVEDQGQATKSIVLPKLPLEISEQVPCVNADRGCTAVFATYKAAIQHDNKHCKKKQADGPFSCP